MDIDLKLVEMAQERLAANGYTPTLITVDGWRLPAWRTAAEGQPPAAPQG